jgi:hypothetical protein
MDSTVMSISLPKTRAAEATASEREVRNKQLKHQGSVAHFQSWTSGEAKLNVGGLSHADR